MAMVMVVTNVAVVNMPWTMIRRRRLQADQVIYSRRPTDASGSTKCLSERAKIALAGMGGRKGGSERERVRNSGKGNQSSTLDTFQLASPTGARVSRGAGQREHRTKEGGSQSSSDGCGKRQV